jgi:hypothetical protein
MRSGRRNDSTSTNVPSSGIGPPNHTGAAVLLRTVMVSSRTFACEMETGCYKTPLHV